MVDYFPVMIVKGETGVIGSVIETEMIFIDKYGTKIEPEIVNAVLNGVAIDTQGSKEANANPIQSTTTTEVNSSP